MVELEDRLVDVITAAESLGVSPSWVRRRIADGELPAVRIGGLVKEGSVVKSGKDVTFAVTDRTKDLSVSYTGLLPDLFREGQGVVVDGVLNPDGAFRADSVLAKHDERYMPKDVADKLKAQGVWQGEKK